MFKAVKMLVRITFALSKIAQVLVHSYVCSEPGAYIGMRELGLKSYVAKLNFLKNL